MGTYSNEQRDIIMAPLGAISVIACAGSGKTRTAVQRLANVRRLMGHNRGRAILLSFSNVAVDTFSAEYRGLTQSLPLGSNSHKVEIDTLDGFITKNVLQSHAYRTMESTNAPFLVNGSEDFLQGFRFWIQSGDKSYPVDIQELQIGFDKDGPFFYYLNNDQILLLDNTTILKTVNGLGKTGAYTHNLGRYWCYRTLKEQPKVLKALARRYPHILIDEAQDIGMLHEAIVEQLISNGAQVSLIGDPNQGIYGFAGANGVFLSGYADRANIKRYGLTTNYRSTPNILNVANKVTGRSDTAYREQSLQNNELSYIPYKKSEYDLLIDTFKNAVLNVGLKLENSAILCRGRELVKELNGTKSEVGVGLVKKFALAARIRDKQKNYLEAFRITAYCLVCLLKSPPSKLLHQILHPNKYPNIKPVTRLIWRFTKNENSGLPHSNLIADSEWHTQLVKNVRTILEALENDHGLVSVERLGLKLKNQDLPNLPLLPLMDLATQDSGRLRIDTVHQAKGESIDAVLYIATKEQVKALLSGINTEIGRIGYVAITRAKNMLWIAIPHNSEKELSADLISHGFKKV